MGIQGLLPLLKPIHRHKKVCEFSGQTLAVDAYVWLHRGAYACAQDIVQGRPTLKYVEYCMHRVRFLRHHGIKPYLVFDGGPLPAKEGTEKEREKRRADTLKRAKECAARGDERQARELYVKCVDVTPQMAYQVIKALKAEKVPFVVAPYEADAQLAYLERIGLVDGIITEDSDLLVFGCRNVLFKLDIVQATVVSISRSDFGSTSLASDSFSLVGWSDADFRWMSMLSGCDYLPSIPGIGLKTAYQLLKRHKTVERAVKMIRLEGKKDVPKRYLEAFSLAEKVFLHQRVYDPSLERLVLLSGATHEPALSENVDSYIGRPLSDELAKGIAEGTFCPISRSIMEDINPTFHPENTDRHPLRNHDTNISRPARQTPTKKKTGILNFFTPIAKTPSNIIAQCAPISSSVPSKSSSKVIAGANSGKRTLVEAMEQDIELKRKKTLTSTSIDDDRAVRMANSKFFPDDSNISSNSSSSSTPSSDWSLKENVDPLEGYDNELNDDVIDLVIQEDGYLSPSPCFSRNLTPDLSSPVSSFRHPDRGKAPDKSNHAYEAHPQDPSPSTTERAASTSRGFPPSLQKERILVRGSSEPQDTGYAVIPGPDLCANFDTEEETIEEENIHSDLLVPSPGSTSATSPTSTQPNSRTDSWASLDAKEDNELDEKLQVTARGRIAKGWASRFSFVGQSPAPKLGPRKTGDCISLEKVPVPQAERLSHLEMKHHRSEPRMKRKRNQNLIPSPRVQTFTSVGLGSQDAPIVLEPDDIEEYLSSANARLDSFRFIR